MFRVPSSVSWPNCQLDHSLNLHHIRIFIIGSKLCLSGVLVELNDWMMCEVFVKHTANLGVENSLVQFLLEIMFKISIYTDEENAQPIMNCLDNFLRLFTLLEHIDRSIYRFSLFWRTHPESFVSPLSDRSAIPHPMMTSTTQSRWDLPPCWSM